MHKMIESAGAIIAKEIGEAVDALKSCVTPIFSMNEKREAGLLGSAVLIAAAGETFLCTAKHVIDENANSTLYIDGPSKLEILEGDFHCSEEHDVAVLKLTLGQATALQKYVPLPAERIAIPPEATASKYAELVGFPEKKNPRAHRQNKIRGHRYKVGGMIIDFTPERVRVSFNRKRNIDVKTRLRVTAPYPHCMSGGAIFGAAVNAGTLEGKPVPKLIGIMSDWPEAEKEIFGAGMAIAMAIVRDAWRITLPPRLDPKYVTTHLFVKHMPGSKG